MSARKAGWNPDVVTRTRKTIPRAAFDANIRDVAGVLYRFYGGKTQPGGSDEEFRTDSILDAGEKL